MINCWQKCVICCAVIFISLKLLSTKKSAKFGIQAVYSDEQTIKPDAINLKKDALRANIHTVLAMLVLKIMHAITGLNCAGYGSSVCVTAPFGFAAAGLAIQHY